jgi:hypothetical protein
MHFTFSPGIPNQFLLSVCGRFCLHHFVFKQEYGFKYTAQTWALKLKTVTARKIPMELTVVLSDIKTMRKRDSEAGVPSVTSADIASLVSREEFETLLDLATKTGNMDDGRALVSVRSFEMYLFGYFKLCS